VACDSSVGCGVSCFTSIGCSVTTGVFSTDGCGFDSTIVFCTTVFSLSLGFFIITVVPLVSYVNSLIDDSSINLIISRISCTFNMSINPPTKIEYIHLYYLPYFTIKVLGTSTIKQIETICKVCAMPTNYINVIQAMRMFIRRKSHLL